MKNLGLQYLFIIILGLFHISCSEEKESSGQEIFIEVSSKIKAYYADTNLSPEYPFPKFTWISSDEFIGHNMVRKSLDTLFFDGDTLRIKEGPYFENDGPRKVENFNNLVSTSEGLVFFNSKNIMIDRDGVSDIKNFRLIEDDVFDNSVFFNLNGGVSYYLDELYKGYDKKREQLYFFALQFQTKEFKLLAFDLGEKKFKELPMWANINLIQANEVSFKGISKNHMPFIFVDGDRLILSYNYSNDLVIVDLGTGHQIEKNFPSNLFPLYKKAPKEINPNYDLSNLEHFKMVNELLNEWDRDVAFGNFEKLPKNRGFCRLVKSPQKENTSPQQISLEVFDIEFEKVGEVNLSEIEVDLSTFYFVKNEKLFFKAKNQEDENYLSYYFVEVDY
ncbi:MAG: hypothetical protein EA341_08785 [Mongoliibacter sp.]|uniref:hypothetical protein n=1 Tax=Mongoliibacter sp. TaxID=2022438 RepID=UPI0012F2C2A5|nr:hypothetical protein [Mongoliibacter sp.]TVP49891.1 MAG: hypothetical protein EA341_08785 [Mongoliibacter sp.]